MAIKTNESVNLTQEEIQQLKELRTKTSDLTFLRGQIGIAEDNIKRQLNELAEQFNELYKTESEISQDMFKKYGKGGTLKDKILADVIKKINTLQPAIIGLDLWREKALGSEADYQNLLTLIAYVELFKRDKKIFKNNLEFLD